MVTMWNVKLKGYVAKYVVTYEDVVCSSWVMVLAWLPSLLCGDGLGAFARDARPGWPQL